MDPLTGPARRCAVLGSPIQHSLSPALHRAAYAQLGLDWAYDRYELTEAELPAFVGGCDASWRGLSLTMPLKRVALQLGEPDEVAALVGAANTLLFADDGTRWVHNTDVGGLVAAVQRTLAGRPERVTILGAGATARSALVSASRLGASRVTLVARDVGKAEVLRPLAEACAVQLSVAAWADDLAAADLVVSTVTAGAADARAHEISGTAPVVFDAIYDPWPTPLARAAEEAGRTVLNGLDLLTEQAVLQIELMTGHRVDSALLLRVARSELAARLQDEQPTAAVPHK